MAYIEPEVVAKAKEMDLLTYLQNYEPGELVRISGNTYGTKTHSSLKISNGKWMWWANGIGGSTALDYLIKVNGKSFVEAVETIMGYSAVKPAVYAKTRPKDESKELLLPNKSASTKRITEYLYGRGIDYAIIGECIRNGLIFESLPYHNIVFVGFDETYTPKYAAYRATNNQRIMGDCSGSDKRFSFRLADSDSNEVHLFECAVDLLSYATIYKMSGKDYHNLNLISLAGVYAPKENLEESKVPVALTEYLKNHPTVKRIVLHLDNDNAGRKATKALQVVLNNKYEVIDNPPPQGKDFNDFLCLKLSLPINKNKERSRSYER